MQFKSFVKGLVAATFVASVFLAGAKPASAQTTATANATASIADQISIANTGGLAFGSVLATTAGSVTVSAAGARSSVGVTLLPASPFSAAQFTVTGLANASYSVTLPAAATLTNGTDTLSVGAFTATASPGTIGLGGSGTLGVGATLTVVGTESAGVYTGTFDVSVAYN